MIHIAVLLIAVVQLLDVFNLIITEKRLKAIDEELDLLAKECRDTTLDAHQQLIKQRIENIDVMDKADSAIESAKGVIERADEVINAANELTRLYRKLIQEEETNGKEESNTDSAQNAGPGTV